MSGYKLCVFTTDAKSVLADELFGPGSIRNAEAEKKAAARRGAAKKSGVRKGKRAYEGTSAAVGSGSWSEVGSSSTRNTGSGSGQVSAGKLAAYAGKLQPGVRVVHEAYGAGLVVSQDGKRVRIRFEDKERVLSIKTLYQKKLLR